MNRRTSALANPGRAFLIAACAAAVAVMAALAGPALAFKVIKNVNDGKPPVDKLVLFEKGQSADTLVFKDTPECKLALDANGSLVCDITGNAAIRPIVHWKPRGDLRETLDGTKFNSLVITFRLEGKVKSTQPNGKVVELRGGNLWFSFGLVDTKDTWTGVVNLADFTGDGATPEKTVTLGIPMSLLAKPEDARADAHQVAGFAFTLGAAHPEQNRDFHLVVDKISLAD